MDVSRQGGTQGTRKKSKRVIQWLETSIKLIVKSSVFHPLKLKVYTITIKKGLSTILIS
jgi:hypothetical protein